MRDLITDSSAACQGTPHSFKSFRLSRPIPAWQPPAGSSPEIRSLRRWLQVPAAPPPTHRRRRRGNYSFLELSLVFVPAINLGLVVGLLLYFSIDSSSPADLLFKGMGSQLTRQAVPYTDLSLSNGASTRGDASSQAEADDASAEASFTRFLSDTSRDTADRAAPVQAMFSTSQPAKTQPAMISPVWGFPVSSMFGKRLHPITQTWKLHKGIDFATPIGTPIHAADSGQVIHAGLYKNYGNTVIIRHENGYETLYAHLDTVQVAVGDAVTQRAVVAHSGNTGYSTGPHLHFEVRRYGIHRDPWDYIGDIQMPLRLRSRMALPR